MKSSNFKYLVIEDDTNVWANIERRMSKFPGWEPAGFSAEIDDCKEKIMAHYPQIIFSDWSIKGGNAFDVLNFIRTIPNYEPYIIFFTGYQSEHPEIPEKIINKYSFVKKYIVKPIYENLTEHLAEYVKEAEETVIKRRYQQPVFIENEFKQKIKIFPKDCIAVTQCTENPRLKILHIKNKESMKLRYTWEQIYDFLDFYKLDYAVINHRKYLVLTSHITRIHKPFVYLTDELKLEVSREKWAAFSKDFDFSIKSEIMSHELQQ